ncbi:unnamed protein product [Enterobius vermicularis]|uniref:Troponin I n=1 Tax=Enterobius vermicularis TaxID=51028 RepID=A0A0N4VET3_ENTVE|nr:unnamed protein product [Enterobius vermicularis]
MPPKPTAKKEVASNAEPAAPKNTKEDKMQAAMDKFAAELNKESDEEGAGDDNFNVNGSSNQLTEAEKEELRKELKKTEDEINTLRQVLVARQKHASELKRKLGISPLTELTADINQSLQHVKSSQAYQKTSEVVSDTADTVKNKWNDMRNSAFFKSFESKLGSAYQNVRVGAVSQCNMVGKRKA